jgi:hypothetical protein
MKIELTRGFDMQEVTENLRKERDRRMASIAKEATLRLAFEYMVGKYIVPILEDKLIIQAYTPSYGGYDFYVQVLVSSRAEISEWVQLFEKGGFKLWDNSKEERERASSKQVQGENLPYLSYNMMPNSEMMDDINKKFGQGTTLGGHSREISSYAFDVYIHAFPDVDADCKITSLGKVKKYYEQEVFDISCSEGAKEMQALLGLEG